MPIPKEFQFNPSDDRITKQIKKTARNSMKRLWKKQMVDNPTQAEKVMWSHLLNKQMGVRFSRQILVHGYIVDFWCGILNVAVEVDGGYHNTPQQIAYDQKRDSVLQAKGIAVLRISNNEVLNEIEQCKLKIKTALRVKLNSFSKRKQKHISIAD